MKSKLAKLIDVKSIMTLMLTMVFCVLALMGTISGTEFLSIFTMIVGFYFGTQATKKVQEPPRNYIGPHEGMAVTDQTVADGNTVLDQAMENDVHPPDVVVHGFSG